MNQDGLNFVHKMVWRGLHQHAASRGCRAVGLDVDVNDAVVADAVVTAAAAANDVSFYVGLRLEVLQLKITKSV